MVNLVIIKFMVFIGVLVIVGVVLWFVMCLVLFIFQGEVFVDCYDVFVWVFGCVVELGVDVGDFVEKGDVLVMLEVFEFQMLLQMCKVSVEVVKVDYECIIIVCEEEVVVRQVEFDVMEVELEL